ncbi:3-oxoacyl-[acyl-carrier protein] reductase [Arenibacter palladensis]|uniref:3-oxoacyl-[acyl-carrier protein] reductase n=1 Tax=Arenibacter palladensis TaxID=237373 RepID=A0A1M4SX13_9FLAO|nr:SDR family oxidoreductase [Arenibacter palladensis]SHE36557.1 3-oxoacyl-[acyl-carrier protein] reductase [Arenibacter palladensis]
MGRLKNKVAIVTGAADGIGLAISRAFAKEGAIVVMADINDKKCRQESDELLKQNQHALPLFCDVGNTDSVNEMVKTCIESFGKIDVLVNNAAISISGNITKMPDQDWDLLMNVNLKGVFRCIKSCLPYMLKAEMGSVINIASGQAHRSWNDWTAYATAKGGMISMTNQLAGQFGNKNIRFNTISPGAILTPMATERIKSEGEKYTKESERQAAMLRFGKPKEVAMAAVFLASDESSFITGDDMKVDGGLCTLPRYMG